MSESPSDNSADGLPGSSKLVARYKAEMPTIGIMLVILAIVWFMGLGPRGLIIGLAVCVLGSPLFPSRLAWLANLLAFALLAGVAYFYYGAPQIALALGVIGAVLSAFSYFSKGRV